MRSLKKNIIVFGAIATALLILLPSATVAGGGIFGRIFANKSPEGDLVASPFVTCFAWGTKITLADGTTKNMEDIEAGDSLLSYNVEQDAFTSWTVKSISKPNRPVYNINDGLLQVTEDHPLWTRKADGQVGWGSDNSDA